MIGPIFSQDAKKCKGTLAPGVFGQVPYHPIE